MLQTNTQTSSNCTVIQTASLEDLKEYVHHHLCDHYCLDPQHTPLQCGIIRRREKPCGLFFLIEGPRLLRAYAIWAGEENRILFYDTDGERFDIIQLSESPDPKKLAA